MALSSDHNPVRFDLNLNRKDAENTPCKKISFKNTNWVNFKRDINSVININNNINTKETLNNETEKLTLNIKTVMIKHATIINTRPHSIETTPEILQQIKDKNRTRRQWQRNRDPETKAVLNEKTRQVREALTQMYNESWNKTLQNVNEQGKDNTKLWRLFKRIKRAPEQLPAIVHNGRTYHSNEEKADVLAENFANIQTYKAISDIEREVAEKVQGNKTTNTQ